MTSIKSAVLSHECHECLMVKKLQFSFVFTNREGIFNPLLSCNLFAKANKAIKAVIVGYCLTFSASARVECFLTTFLDDDEL
jgi:hypothetical protein